MGRRGLLPYRHQDPPAVKEGEKMSENQVEMIDDEALTDLACAKRLMTLYGERHIHYCDDVGSWMEYDGTKWARVRQSVIASNYADESITFILQEVAKQASESPGGNLKDKAMYLTRFCKKKNARSLFDMVRLAEGIDPWKMRDFDLAPYFLNCANGYLDLKTGELKPHLPSHMCTKCTGVNYISQPHSSYWVDRLKEIIPDQATRHYVHKIMGAALQGTVREHEIYFFIGKGRNGKGIIVETVAAALGDYASTLPVDVLMASRYASGQDTPTPYVASLRGVRFTRSNESEVGRTMSASMVKWLTGGDELRGRNLHENPISFKPSHHLFFSTNYPPALRDANDHAIRERVRVIPFTVTFSEEEGRRDVGLGEQLRTREMKEDVLQWLVEGYQLYMAEGLNPPPAVKNASGAYFEENDVIGDFIQESCILNKGAAIMRQDLYHAFKQWSENAGIRYPLSNRAFYQAMDNVPGVSAKRTNEGRYFEGIGLIPVNARTPINMPGGDRNDRI